MQDRILFALSLAAVLVFGVFLTNKALELQYIKQGYKKVVVPSYRLEWAIPGETVEKSRFGVGYNGR